MFEGYGPASRSMTFPAAITVQGLLSQLPTAAHRARIDARPTAEASGDRATPATLAPRMRRDPSPRKVQPASPSACRAAASCSVRHAS
jgi:hypothetical protein